ncbi:hypothetical protein KP509_13G035000 [Ceratopteris richardii]|uniref:Uncharacterized protein n=1 Tax=Ceratopteris richardii TaxID=49495 RepID=A0A8T2TK37_CERRI|nr:hypothetical protein KP509_13G035000 [Ceratopteris richardii]
MPTKKRERGGFILAQVIISNRDKAKNWNLCSLMRRVWVRDFNGHKSAILTEDMGEVQVMDMTHIDSGC